MLVYGDARQTRRTAELIEAAAAGGPDAFFEASQLAQALIDAEFRESGHDDLTPTHSASMALLLALARDETPAAALAALGRLASRDEVSVTVPEGYAFYAVYPQAYRMAARSVAWSAPPLVIGLRSIGTGLAAVVAAATGGTPLTLRPAGHPFAREVRPSPALRARLRAHGGPFAIVDEGPGLSGSSFGAVADLLEEIGVRPDRIVFMPSHAGPPGPQASPRHRLRWDAGRKAVATLDDLLDAEPIAEWFADITGPVAVEDLSAGAWRGGRDLPADPPRERRKFRLHGCGASWVARFAGLGPVGREKLARAQRLSQAGLAVAPLALRRGFMLQPWVDGAALDPRGAERPRFLSHVARYIAFRGAAFPAPPEAGADGETLSRMILTNAGVRVRPPPQAPRAHIDGRLHRWEWLRRTDGSYCKLDALDHSCSHDLVGCQSLAWDIAGAVVEFGLSDAERAELVRDVSAAGGPSPDPPALEFYELAYSAFQFGLWSLAEPTPANRAQRQIYERRLRAVRTA